MINPRDALRLLREDWSHPADLARELFTLIASRAPAQIEAPLTIKVPQGQTALRLVQGGQAPPPLPVATPGRPTPRAKTPPPQVPTRRSSFEAGPAPAAAPIPAVPFRPAGAAPEPAAPRLPGSPSLAATPITEAPDVTARTPAARTSAPTVGIPGLSPSLPSLEPGRRLAAPALLPPPDNALSPPDASPTLVPPPPAPAPLGRPTPRRPLPAASAPGGGPGMPAVPSVAPYRAPALEIEGPASFRGHEPVQFEAPPLLLNPETGQFEPFHFHPDFVPIPREHPIQVWIGQVYTPTSSGDEVHEGNQWDVNIYPDGPDDDSTKFPVVVKVLGIPESSTDAAPSGQWIRNIYRFADPKGGEDRWYWVMPLVGKFAVTPSAGIQAATVNVAVNPPTFTAGSATCTMYDFDPTAGSLKNPRQVTLYNSSSAVAGSKLVQVKLIDGCWFVDVEGCS